MLGPGSGPGRVLTPDGLWAGEVARPDGDGFSWVSRDFDNVYDRVGNVIAEVDRFGNRVGYQYHDRGRLKKKTMPNHLDGTATGPVIEFGYDAASRLTSQTDPLLNVTSFGHDALGRITSVTEPPGNKA